MEFPNVAAILGMIEVGTVAAPAAYALIEAVVNSGKDIPNEEIAKLEDQQANSHARLQSLLRSNTPTAERPAR